MELQYRNLTPMQGTCIVMDRLNADDIAYAASVDRGEYKGFAALHDLCDANMLLPFAEDDHASDMNDYVTWCNAVMGLVTAQIAGA